MLKGEGVPRNFVAAVQVDAAGLPLQVDQAQIRRAGKRDDDERPAGGGVSTGGEGQHLKGDVALPVADIDETAQLG